MTMAEVANLLQELGGYGVAGLMFWFWRQEREERLRYRNLYEIVLGELPAMTSALKELTDEVARQNQANTTAG